MKEKSKPIYPKELSNMNGPNSIYPQSVGLRSASATMKTPGIRYEYQVFSNF